MAQAPDADGRLISRELGMLLEIEDTLLRLIDTRTGRRLMTFDELFDVADDAQRKILQAQRKADEARERAEEARHQADEAARDAEAERRRNAALQAEIARLRAALDRPETP